MGDVILDGNVINAANPLQVEMAGITGPLQVTTQTPVSIVSAPFTGRVIVAKSGTPVQGGDIASSGGFYVKGLPANSGKMYIFGIGQTKLADSYVLGASEVMYLPVSNLNLVQVDADNASEGVCWVKGA